MEIKESDWKQVVKWLKNYYNFILGEYNDITNDITEFLEKYDIEIKFEDFEYIKIDD